MGSLPSTTKQHTTQKAKQLSHSVAMCECPCGCWNTCRDLPFFRAVLSGAGRIDGLCVCNACDLAVSAVLDH